MEKLAIIIVNYNIKNELEKCIESIYQNPPSCDYSINVVDNASKDNSVQMVREKFPNVNLYANKENLGFAKANNIVLRKVKSEFVLILNPDTIVLPRSLDVMLNFIEKDAETAIVGPKLIDYRKNVLNSCEMYPSLNSELIQSFYLDKLGIFTKWISKFTLSRWDHNSVREVDWITGACLMVRMKAMNDIGLMDENYFLYYEDVDLCYRIKKKGWKVYFLPDVQIIHHQGRSTKTILDKTILISHKSKYHFLRTYAKKEDLDKYKMIVDLGIRLRLIIWAICYLFDIKNRPFNKARLIAYFKSLKIIPFNNVAFDVTSFSRFKAGVEYYIKNMFMAISRADLNGLNFISIDLSSNRKESNTSVFTKIFRGFNLIYQIQIRLPYLLSKNRISVLHSPAYVSPVFKICPYVMTIHDLSFMLFPEMFISTYRLYLKILMPLSVKRADLIIAVSEHTKQDIIKILKVPEEKIKVIYEGAEERFYKSHSPYLIKSFIKKNNLPEKFILFVGTLEPRKNLKGLLKAYSIYSKRTDKPLKLVLTGMKGWLYNDVFELIETLNLKDNVIFTGYLSDDEMPYLYNAASLFVYPSFYEGFGLPVVEAMACGTPVIASNVSSLPEVLGNAGILIDPNNIEEIALAIQNILEDDKFRHELIEKGLTRAKDFSWDKAAQETIKIYKECIDTV